MEPQGRPNLARVRRPWREVLPAVDFPQVSRHPHGSRRGEPREPHRRFALPVPDVPAVRPQGFQASAYDGAVRLVPRALLHPGGGAAKRGHAAGSARRGRPRVSAGRGRRESNPIEAAKARAAAQTPYGGIVNLGMNLGIPRSKARSFSNFFGHRLEEQP